MPEISVIVVNWNRKEFLGVCLGALKRQSYRDFETIIVDNGSTDGSQEYVREHFPEVHLLAVRNNLGFAGGNSIGYANARGNLIALLNNDTEADPNWLAEMHGASMRHPEVSSFASKMLFFDDRQRIDNCGLSLTTAGINIDRGRGQLDGVDWLQPEKVFGACAGAAVYRRTMLDDIGFFDTDFFMVYEDVDLGFRAQLRGHECLFVPKAVVYHRLRASLAQRPALFFAQRNIEYVYVRNLPLRLALTSLPQRLLYELGGAAYSMKLGHGANFIRAKFAAYRRLPSLLRQRHAIQSRKLIANRQLRSKMSTNWLSDRWKKFIGAWRASVGAQIGKTPTP